MSRLKGTRRARLPDRAFAYIDARGRRRLPIHDKAHVRNALARFNQVVFESDAALKRARQRLLNAAKKFRIVPVGFITGQLESERRRGQEATSSLNLPAGFVTLLMTDIEASTTLLRTLGERYGALLDEVRDLIRRAVSRGNGREIDARADEFFAVFEDPAPAVEAAVTVQRALADHAWPDGVTVQVRVGIHSGRPTVNDSGYIGLAVHTTARVCSAAHGGQILVSAATRAAMGTSPPAGVRFRTLGRHRLPGLPDAEALFQVQTDGLRVSFPRPRTGRSTVRREPARAGLEPRTASEQAQLELPQPEQRPPSDGEGLGHRRRR
jgi:class 3 adenylate cyclase